MRQPTLSGLKRTTVVSTAVHALLFAMLIVAGSGQGPWPALPSIIEAEFLSDIEPAPTAIDELIAETPSTPPPRNAQAPTAVQTQAAAVEADAPTPAKSLPDTAVADAQTTTTTPAPDIPDADATTAATGTPLPMAEPTASATDNSVATTHASSSAPPGRRLDDTEQAMLAKRLESWTGSFTPNAPDPTLTWRENGRRYTAVLRRQPATDATSMDHLTVEVTTESDGDRLLTELRMTRMAFSNFAQFVDRWDPEVVVHDDEIDGRFHSNSTFRVNGGPGVRPVFRGKVTLAASNFETASGTLGSSGGWVNRRTMFPAGLKTMAHRISLAPRLPPDTRGDDVQRFDHDAAITFYEDGSYGWRSGVSSQPEQRGVLTDRPHYLIGTRDNVTLEVQGTVHGTVLVYTPGRIVIVHDLRYAHDPHEPGAADYLGLVAERSVEIDEPNVTGPGDLEVYASIYARELFAVRNYLSKPAGKLFVYGSLAAGSLTATEPRYATSVHFDPRLTTMRAPGFPLSDRYELESSSGEWRSVPATAR